MTFGRARNDIANSFISILKKVLVDHPNITGKICWSDSCVPQNRNSHISQAILKFLSQVETINTITMRYSVSGHSSVEEVDNMHKQIEDRMQVAEFYSPISFLRILLKVNRNQPYHIIQMRNEDFMDYQNSAKIFRFNLIPYSKVAQFRFPKANLHQVGFKHSRGDREFQFVNIGKRSIRETSKKMSCQFNFISIQIKFLNLVSNVLIKTFPLQNKLILLL